MTTYETEQNYHHVIIEVVRGMVRVKQLPRNVSLAIRDYDAPLVMDCNDPDIVRDEDGCAYLLEVYK